MVVKSIESEEEVIKAGGEDTLQDRGPQNIISDKEEQQYDRDLDDNDLAAPWHGLSLC